MTFVVHDLLNPFAMLHTSNLQLTIPWAEVKEKIKEANIELSDEDLDHPNEDVLLAHLSEKMNMSQADVKGWIESVSANKGKAS
jgi:tRNA1(Val) A37 N6-methylase TrmN6